MCFLCHQLSNKVVHRKAYHKILYCHAILQVNSRTHELAFERLADKDPELIGAALAFESHLLCSLSCIQVYVHSPSQVVVNNTQHCLSTGFCWYPCITWQCLNVFSTLLKTIFLAKTIFFCPKLFFSGKKTTLQEFIHLNYHYCWWTILYIDYNIHIIN